MPLKNLNYSQNLTKRVPRKLSRMKEPNLEREILERNELYRRETLREVLKRDLNFLEVYRYNSFYRLAIVQFEFMVKKLSKCKDGRDLHIYLPLTGMEPVGYYYKGYLEQHYPKARVTFLVTPKGGHYEEYLTNNIKRSFNVNDKLFFVFDYFAHGTTLDSITRALRKIVSNPKVVQISTPESVNGIDTPKNFTKDYRGKEIRPVSSLKASERGYDFGEKNGKEYTPKELEKIRNITQQFFYYHGSKLQIDYKDEDIKAFLKKLRLEKDASKIEPEAYKVFRNKLEALIANGKKKKW